MAESLFVGCLTSQIPSPARTRILLADDEALTRELMRIELLNHDYEVVTVSNGREALEACHSEPHFDVAVLDYRMPEMNGIEAGRCIKACAPDTELVLMTAEGDTEIRGHLLSWDIRPECLIKPFCVESLIAIIRRVVRLRHKLETPSITA